MKFNYVFNVILAAVAGAILASCSGNSFEKVFPSPDGKAKLTVNAEQPVVMDPYKLSIRVEGYGHDDTLNFEVYTTELMEEDVDMKWTADTEGVLSIKEPEGNVRKLNFSISPEHISLRE